MNWMITSAIVLMVVLTIGTLAVAFGGDSGTEETETIDCSSCGEGCTQARNCGQSTCGAVIGGSCGCGD